MKLSSTVFALFACAVISGMAFAARAEEQAGYPVQYEIEARQIHQTHAMHNFNCGRMDVMAQETIAPAILFATGSDKLTSAAATSVKKVAAILKSPAYKGKHVLISGYTDNKGKDAVNQRLSYHRASMVVKQLEKLGVPASQLTAQGFGKENPVATNTTAEGRAQNRRVTFTLAEEPMTHSKW